MNEFMCGEQVGIITRVLRQAGDERAGYIAIAHRLRAGRRWRQRQSSTSAHRIGLPGPLRQIPEADNRVGTRDRAVDGNILVEVRGSVEW